MDHIFTSQKWFLLLVATALFFLFYLLGPILSPFLVGALLAYLTDPMADRLEELGASRTAAVVIVFIVLSTLFSLAILMFLPKLGNQIQLMMMQIPQVIDLFENSLFPAMQQQLGADFKLGDFSMIKTLIAGNWAKTGNIMTHLAASVTKSSLAVMGWIANLLLIPVVTFYLLRDWDVMMAKISHLLPRNIEPKVRLLATESDEVLGAFIKGQLLVMLALGTVYALGLWLVGVNLALLLGLLAGVASIVPYMGFIVGIVASGVAAYMQFQEPMVLVWVGVVFGIGQLLEGMVLTPLLVGDRIGLHPVAVIFAIMAGGQLFGFVGVLIALPVAAVIMVFLRHLHDGYKNSHLYGFETPVEQPEEILEYEQEEVVNEQQ